MSSCVGAVAEGTGVNVLVGVDFAFVAAHEVELGVGGGEVEDVGLDCEMWLAGGVRYVRW